MSTVSAIGRQSSISSTFQQFDYGNWSGFSSQAISIFSHVFSFLESESLKNTDFVCRNWHVCNSSVIGQAVWRRYIGEVGPVPQIPKAISLKNWDKPDPCDPTTTIGKEYVWIYFPDHIEIKVQRLAFSTPETPADKPRIIRITEVEKVPIMLNSIEALFKRPKAGRPSKYAWIWDKIVTEQGDKSIPARWVCMRRKVICRELSFDAQRALVNEKGLKIPHLLHRIIFNFLEYARSGVYPDGAKPMTFARTATLTMHNEREWSLGCGMGDSSGLNVYNGLFYTAIDSDTAGISVAL